MSNLKIQGNASGAGTTTLQSANTASSTTFTLPGTDGTANQVLQTDGSGNLSFTSVPSLSANNAFTGANTFYNATGQTFGRTATQDGILLTGRNGGTLSYRVTFTPTTLTGNRTLTLPDASGTVATVGNAIAFSIVFGL